MKCLHTLLGQSKVLVPNQLWFDLFQFTLDRTVGFFLIRRRKIDICRGMQLERF